MSTFTMGTDAAVEARLDQVTRRGTALYEERLREALERDHLGAVVAIHPDSGDWVVADESPGAMCAMVERHPEGLMVVRRIGPPTPGDLRLAVRAVGARAVYGG